MARPSSSPQYIADPRTFFAIETHAAIRVRFLRPHKRALERGDGRPPFEVNVCVLGFGPAQKTLDVIFQCVRPLVEEALLNGLRSRSAAQPVGRQGLVRASLPGIGGRKSARGREQDRRADLDLSDEVGGIGLDVAVVVVVDVLRDHASVCNILLRCHEETFFV